jgi:bacillithiol system protein YtxJ
MISWENLDSQAGIDDIVIHSHTKPCVILKHSTTCSISSMAKSRLERDWDKLDNAFDAYYLDLLRYRPLSKELAERFQVHHESPQVLVIHNGVCVYDASHLDISVRELKESVAL